MNALIATNICTHAPFVISVSLQLHVFITPFDCVGCASIVNVHWPLIYFETALCTGVQPTDTSCNDAYRMCCINSIETLIVRSSGVVGIGEGEF